MGSQSLRSECIARKTNEEPIKTSLRGKTGHTVSTLQKRKSGGTHDRDSWPAAILNDPNETLEYPEKNLRLSGRKNLHKTFKIRRFSTNDLSRTENPEN